MTGLQLAQAVRARRPRLPLVLATGYAELPEGAEATVDARLAKPFGQDELMRVLSRVARGTEQEAPPPGAA